jgi:hypothetical protein
MRNPTVPEIDRKTEKVLAAIALWATMAGLAAQFLPQISTPLLLALALWTALHFAFNADREPEPDEPEEEPAFSDDSRLADVAIANTERPA